MEPVQNSIRMERACTPWENIEHRLSQPNTWFPEPPHIIPATKQNPSTAAQLPSTQFPVKTMVQTLVTPRKSTRCPRKRVRLDPDPGPVRSCPVPTQGAETGDGSAETKSGSPNAHNGQTDSTKRKKITKMSHEHASRQRERRCRAARAFTRLRQLLPGIEPRANQSRVIEYLAAYLRYFRTIVDASDVEVYHAHFVSDVRATKPGPEEVILGEDNGNVEGRSETESYVHESTSTLAVVTGSPSAESCDDHVSAQETKLPENSVNAQQTMIPEEPDIQMHS